MKKHKIPSILNTILVSTALWLLISVFAGCIKDKDYEYPKVYDEIFKSLQFGYSVDSLPADGSSRCTITIKVLPDNKIDSINLAAIGLSLTASSGTFAETNSATMNVPFTYKLDTPSNTKLLSAVVNLVSSTTVGKAKITIKFGGVESAKLINFFYVYPDKVKLSVTSFLIQPDFATADTILMQLSSATGLPSKGTMLGMQVFDSLYQRQMGLFRVSADKTNAAGNGTFIYVLGDNVINNVNYRGTLHVVGFTNGIAGRVADTIDIYSR